VRVHRRRLHHHGQRYVALDPAADFTVGQLRARLFRTGDYFVANGTFDPEYVLGYGIPDADAAGFDCNGNGVDDDQDIALGTSQDCNGTGFPDSCDIADGISTDANGNGRPDECAPAGVRVPATNPPAGSGSASVPLVVVPPAPGVGKRLRLALETTAPVGFVDVRLHGARLGRVVATPVASAAGALLELSLPDEPSLAGRTLRLRVLVRDPATGRARWSDELAVRVEP
jgi:hypothetical protein